MRVANPPAEHPERRACQVISKNIFVVEQVALMMDKTFVEWNIYMTKLRNEIITLNSLQDNFFFLKKKNS